MDMEVVEVRDEVAIKVLKDILPAADNHIRRALLRAISSLKADKTITITINHVMPPMPSIGDLLKGHSDSGHPFNMFSKENLDKLFGGEEDV